MNMETRFLLGKVALVGLFMGSACAFWQGMWMRAILLAMSLLFILALSARLAPFGWPRKSKRLPHLLMLHNVSHRMINPITPNNTIRPMTL